MRHAGRRWRVTGPARPAAVGLPGRVAAGVAAGLVVALVAGLLATVPVWAAPVAGVPVAPGPSATRSVPVGSVPAKQRAASLTHGRGITKMDRTALPPGGSGDVPVSGTPTHVGGLPVVLTGTAPAGGATGADSLRPGQRL